MQLTNDEIVNRGSRLASLISSPGFHDLRAICDALVQVAVDNLLNFGGWDTQQIAVLHARAKAAVEFRNGIFSTINQQLEASSQQDFDRRVDEQQAKPEEQVASEADELRAQVLKMYEQFQPHESDGRIPGTY